MKAGEGDRPSETRMVTEGCEQSRASGCGTPTRSPLLSSVCSGKPGCLGTSSEMGGERARPTS